MTSILDDRLTDFMLMNGCYENTRYIRKFSQIIYEYSLVECNEGYGPRRSRTYSFQQS